MAEQVVAVVRPTLDTLPPTSAPRRSGGSRSPAVGTVAPGSVDDITATLAAPRLPDAGAPTRIRRSQRADVADIDDARQRQAPPGADAMGTAPTRLRRRVAADAAPPNERAGGVDEVAPAATRIARRSAPGVIRRVLGGLEYTEGTPTMLWAYDTKPFNHNVVQSGTFQVGTTQLTGFRVGPGTGFIRENATLGFPTNADLDVLTHTPNVKLTNDVESAEWVIERHQVDLPVDQMRARLRQDVDDMFDARKLLAGAVGRIASGHPGEVGIAPGAHVSTAAPPVVFIYDPGALRGKVQITAKYTNQDTIRRINQLNASKFLTGTKVAEGEDVARVTGTASQALLNADVAGTTSFSTAAVLLNALRGASHAIPATIGGGTRLTVQQVGLVKLMVINDALATTMVRYCDTVGQGQDKNLQRFFPKSRRTEYVRAVAAADLDATELGLLRAELQRTTAADALIVFNNADPGALRTDEAFTEVAAIHGLAHPQTTALQNAKQKQRDPTRPAPTAAEMLAVKQAVLGPNGVLLDWWMQIVADAYSEDITVVDDHVFHHPGKPDAKQTPAEAAAFGPGGGGEVSSVLVSSRSYTPLAPGDRGAIYEMREREVPVDKSGLFNIGSLDELYSAIDRLFGAAT